MWWIPIVGLVLLGVLLFEYRIRKPDQLVLHEARGRIKQRKAWIYPRHLSLSIPASVQSISLELAAEAHGSIGLAVRLTIAVTPDPEHLEHLVRAGGWDPHAVQRASDELRIAAHSQVREFCESLEIEAISRQGLTAHLESGLPPRAMRLGLQVLSVAVQSISPADPQIEEQLRQREAARIAEQTERINQEARVAAANLRLQAEASMADAEHALELKRLGLKREQERAQAELAHARVLEEVERRKLQLVIDEQEIALLAENPQLLMLTPQLARLAEASQSLRNARTIVSLSGEELLENSPLLNNLLMLLGGKPQSGSEK